jgi:glycogen debranching enzyme
MRFHRILLLILISFCLLIQGIHAEINYRWKDVFIGALEAGAWGGLVLAPNQESVFAFRIQIEKENEIADRNDILYLISEVGPHSPDCTYARIKLDLSLPFKRGNETPILIKPPSKKDTLTLEWSRQDEKTVIGRITAPPNVKINLVHYFPWNYEGAYLILPEGQIKGESSGQNKYHYLLWTDTKGDLITDPEGEEVTVSFSLEKNRALYFVGGVGEDEKILSDRIVRYKNTGAIDSVLEEEKNRYRSKRVRIDGLYEGTARAITNNLFWMMLYQPGNHRLYMPGGRGWIYATPDGNPGHWTIFEWDSFFNALGASVESSKHAKDILKAVLETQYPNGNIPNWRSRFSGTPDRSHPPIGSYFVLKLFQRLGDLDLLRYAYPYLVRWHSFWKEEKDNGQVRRDGNRDGLLEWGTDTEFLSESVPPWEENTEGKKRSMRESGQDDLPNWDDAPFSQDSGTLIMNCIDLNSLYALDAWCLAEIANFLNRGADYNFYYSEYETMKELINQHLWDEREGFYFDRYWDGRFSTRKAASNFYPLLAGIPDKTRALRMLRHLLNPEEFWGEFVIPTISRDDPSFKDQRRWRGAVWPPANYLIYQGLKAYHFDAVASELAKKSSDLFLRTWKNFQLCPENFDSRTGEAGGQRYQSCGSLFALIALEEYLDFTPWEGFRFGMIDPEKRGKLSRISIQDRHYDVDVSRSEVKLKEEGKEILRAKGSAVFRNFLYAENEISFEVMTLERREIKVQFIIKGKYELLVDDETKKVFKGSSVKFKVPEGEHSVLILLLEKQD